MKFLVRGWLKLKDVFSNQKGQGMVEYGLIIALIAVAVITVLGLLGDNIEGVFNSIVEKISGSGG